MRLPIISILLSALLTVNITYAASSAELKGKIGQLLIFGFNGTELHRSDDIVKDILAKRIGGVILFKRDLPTKSDRNIINPAQLNNLTGQLQSYARAATLNANDLYPLFISIDYEGGKVKRLTPEDGFPQTLSAEEIGKLSYAEAAQYANEMATTLKLAGFNMNFAPDVDVNVNPDNPIIAKYGRSFSNDEKKVAAYASLFSKAYLQQGILCSYKHFPGHGSSIADSHKAVVDITTTWQRAIELYPYQQLLNQDNSCPMVMMAHVVNHNLDSNDYLASTSEAITKGMLRDELHFNGGIVSDDLLMDGVVENPLYGKTREERFETAIISAIAAGTDLLIVSGQATPAKTPQEVINLIYNAVQQGKISEARIDEAYQHVLALKKWLRERDEQMDNN